MLGDLRKRASRRRLLAGAASLGLGALATACAGGGPPSTPAAKPTPTPEPSLRGLAQARGLKIGSAALPLPREPLYQETLAREFSMLTPEYTMKLDHLQPAQGRYEFDQTDAIVDFARREAMDVRGHTLVWHGALPDWLVDGGHTTGELRSILRDYILTVGKHYRGKVVAWDVVNEAIRGDGRLRDTIWTAGLGPGYVDVAFRWAHEADPDAMLFLNDYGGEGMGPKSDAVYSLAKEMVERGVPLHGAGLQMHVSIARSPSPEDVASNIGRLGGLGLEVHITEMDVRVQDSTLPMDERLAAQARIYGDMMRVALDAEACTAFVTWGFTDRHSWIPDFTGNPDAALLFDEAYRPKPAYRALVEALSGA